MTTATPATSNADRWRLVFIAATVLVIILAAFVRIRGALNDLWLDEIWSLDLVREIKSPFEVFTRIHHDNNHYLNSLFMYFAGQRGNWPGYRVPAVIAGCGAVILAWLSGKRRSRATAFFSMALVALSYVLVLYSSEARGYGSLIFFSFLCFVALQSFFDRPRWQAAALFSIGAILGFSSHLTFLIFLLASFIWFCVWSVQSRSPLRKIITNAIFCYAAPALYLGALYLIDLRQLKFGSGTPTPLAKAYVSSLAWTLGVPNIPWVQFIGSGISFVGLLGGLVLLWRKKSDQWAFFAAVIVVVPIILAAFRPREFLYVRYFIISIAFLLLLFGIALSWLWERGLFGRVAAAVLLISYVMANSLHIGELFKYGRGRTTEAIQFMAEHSRPQSTVTFGGDHDLRIMYVLRFYLKFMMQDKATHYYGRRMWPIDGLDWFICHQDSSERPRPPGARYRDDHGNEYDLVGVYPSAPLSGVHWFIFHNHDRPW